MRQRGSIIPKICPKKYHLFVAKWGKRSGRFFAGDSKSAIKQSLPHRHQVLQDFPTPGGLEILSRDRQMNPPALNSITPRFFPKKRQAFRGCGQFTLQRVTTLHCIEPPGDEPTAVPCAT